jgi:hypothetical protein
MNLANEHEFWSKQATEIVLTFFTGHSQELAAQWLFNKVRDRHLRFNIFKALTPSSRESKEIIIIVKMLFRCSDILLTSHISTQVDTIN